MVFVLRLLAILFFWDLPGNKRKEQFVFRIRRLCQTVVDMLGSLESSSCSQDEEFSVDNRCQELILFCYSSSLTEIWPSIYDCEVELISVLIFKL